MNGTMKHLKRFGWLYGLGAAFVTVPFFLWRAQHIPPPDASTLFAYAETFDRELQREHGPFLPPRYGELAGQLGEFSIRFSEVLGDDLGTVHLEAWLEQYGPSVWELAELSSEGIANRPMVEPLTRTEPYTGDAPSFLLLQSRARLHRLSALRAAEAGDWEVARRELRHTADVGTAVRLQGVFGALSATSVRTIAYRSYLRVLGENPPPEVLEAMLADLGELRRTDPVLDEWVLAAEQTVHILSRWRPIRSLDLVSPEYDRRLVFLTNAAAVIVRYREHLSDPALRRRAERYAYVIDRREGERFPKSPVEIFLEVEGHRWRWVPGMVRFVRRVVEREPEFVSEFLHADAVPFEGGDAWTRAVYLARSESTQGLLADNNVRARVAITIGELVREAYAARLHHARTGEWPGPPELEPAEVARLIAEARDDHANPFAPMQSAVLEAPLDPVLVSRWMAQNILVWGIELAADEDDFVYRADFGANLPPEQLLTLAHRFDPEGTESVAFLYYKPPRDHGWDPSTDPFRFIMEVTGMDFGLPDEDEDEEWFDPMMIMEEFAPPTPAVSEVDELWALVVGEGVPMPAILHPAPDEYDPEAVVRHLASHFANVEDRESREREFARHLRVAVEGRLEPPDRLRVLWSPGPDGVDDRAMIPYDPTNGTLSRGDIIVFPEAFR